MENHTVRLLDAQFITNDVWGAIQYKSPGVFIAGGAGITPFISIFRDLFIKKQLAGNKLIYSNKTSEDVIMNEELEGMLKMILLSYVPEKR